MARDGPTRPKLQQVSLCVIGHQTWLGYFVCFAKMGCTFCQLPIITLRFSFRLPWLEASKVKVCRDFKPGPSLEEYP